MAEIKKQARVVDTWKMKKWYKIVSPQLFGNMQIGETIAMEDAGVVGRTVKVSLATLTGDAKKQSTNIIFEINKINNGVAETIVKKLEIAPSSVRRMIRAGKDRVDNSFLCATKDNVIIRIKPFLVTRGKAGGSVLTTMRNLVQDIIRVEASKITYENVLHDVVSGKLQRTVKQYLSHVYPLKASEIRSLEVTTSAKPLPPLPVLPVHEEERMEDTEEEKIEKKVKAKAAEEVAEEVKEEKPKKAKAKKAETEAKEAVETA